MSSRNRRRDDANHRGPLSDDLFRRLDEKARQSGLNREEYVRALLSKDLLGPLSLSQILGPFREQVAASGLTNDELATLFAEAREEAHLQKA